MTEKWFGKTAVVSGTSSGIGYQIMKLFLQNGINTIGLDICPEKSQELIDEFKQSSVNGYVFKCDISNPESVTEVFEKIESQFKFVNIIVNNAGIGRKAEFLDNNPDSLINMNKVIDTNLRGTMLCTRLAYQLMAKSNDCGLIININSIAGHHIPYLDFSMNIYGSTKFAITAMTETIRHELIRADNKKVRIASISPGLVDSGFAAASKYFEGVDQYQFSDAPRLRPIEVAKCVMFILSTPYDVNITEMIVKSTGEKE